MTAENSCTVAVRLKPRASRDRLVSVDGLTIALAVTAPPVDGKANEAMLRALADLLDVPKSACSIIKGLASRNKAVRVSGLNSEVAVRKLKAALSAN
jgi:hypothetical protein